MLQSVYSVVEEEMVNMKITSTVIRGILEEELGRNERMIRRYEKELDALPKGSIVKRVIKGKEYYYLSYREGDKVKTKYVGNSETDISELTEQIEKRKTIVCILKKLKVDSEELKQILK